MNSVNYLALSNGQTASLTALPELPLAEFRSQLIYHVTKLNCRIMAFFAVPENDLYKLIGVLGDPQNHIFKIFSTSIKDRYPSLTNDAPAFHWFEREIAEQYGIIPDGHPWLKPIRFHHSKSNSDAWNREKNSPLVPGETEYYQMNGSATHEVAVGPIHAGVIEPGHFRFQCMGEDVYSLEISLGYQHRGIENMLIGAPNIATLPRIETIAGDSTVAYAIAYSTLIESFSNQTVAPEANHLRAIALELERLANHIGDLGALSGDVAFLPTASFCGRIRGDYLNLTASLCGNRFGRNLIYPRGTRVGLDNNLANQITAKLNTIYPELQHALKLMFNSPTVLDRFENSGVVTTQTAKQIGLVGPAARASGLQMDARRDFPLTEFRNCSKVTGSGDVMARAEIRYQEIKDTHEWLIPNITNAKPVLPIPLDCNIPKLVPNQIGISVVEAWRGELTHVAITDEQGKFRRYKIVDPSFHNWFGLAMALRGEQISNFPICNKSFNLSYCGHDL